MTNLTGRLHELAGEPMNDTIHTKDRLAAALTEAGYVEMAAEAADGKFDDFLSDDPTPIWNLMAELAAVGTPAALALRQRVANGEFDATEEEAEAWAASPEGQALMGKLAKGE